MLWLASLSQLGFSQQQPYTNSYWLNAGDYDGQPTSLLFDPALGEFGYDLGGHVGFGRYAASGHPYWNIKSDINQYFFDPAQLSYILQTQTSYTLPDPQVMPPGSNDQGDIADDHYWFLDSGDVLHWERYQINGAYVAIMWCPQRVGAVPEAQRILMIVPQTVGGGHNIGSIPGPISDAPVNDWDPDQRPPNPEIQAIIEGHYVAKVSGNELPDFFSVVQRAMDAVRFFKSSSGPPEVAFDRVVTYGGSSEAAGAMRIALLAPSWCNGTTNPFYADFPFYAIQGGWQKLNMRLYSALGVSGVNVPVPPGLHSVEFVVFDEPLARGTESAGDWESGLYSVVMRAGELKRPFRGNMGNCDIYFNVHWDLNALQQAYLTSTIGSLQFGTHGIWSSVSNQIDVFDGHELDRLLAMLETTGPQDNPPVKPDGDVPDPYGDPYHVQVYGHTLLELPEDVHPTGSTFLSAPPEGEWVLSGGAAPEQFDGPYGTGVFPGAFDSIRAGNFDDDPAPELVFGNFDGFVEVLEESDGSGGPVLVRQARSAPLGYGISALDVGPLAPGGGTWIVCGTSQGKLYKMPLNPDGSLGSFSNLQNNPDPELREGPGFIPWVVIGNFAGQVPGNEVLVQNERNVCVLFDAGGNELARSTRTPNVVGPDGFTGACGTPVACYWPPVQLPASMVAFAPGVDGRLRRVYYEQGNQQLHVDVVSPEYQAHGRCAWIWDPGSGVGPFVIVGTYKTGQADHDYVLTMIDPETASIVDQFEGYDTPLGPVLAIERFDPGDPDQILVTHTNKVTRVWLDPAGPGFLQTPPAGFTGLPEREIPGVLDAGDYILAGEPIPGVQPELCGTAIYSSQGTDRVGVAAPDGRIWLLDRGTLAFARTTAGLDGVGAGQDQPWYSNRSLGHRFTSDAFSIDGDGMDDTVWVDETGLVYYQPAGDARARIGGLDPFTGVFQEHVHDGVKPTGSNLLNLRGMVVDEAVTPRIPRYFLECGALGDRQGQRYRYALNSGVVPLNGHIFEMGLAGWGGRRVESFDVPVDPIHTDWNGKPWPAMNAGKVYKGQVTANQSLRAIRNFGNGVTFAPLAVGGQSVDHVIVSTLGGFVYAVVADDQSPYAGLNFWSRDLGWGLMGLAVGDVDGDLHNEILVGSHVDTGGYTDWYNPLNPTVPKEPKKNRGQLVLLDTDTAVNGQFQEVVIDISDPADPAITDGFGAGVCGIAIDDIDGNGTEEIWVTDSRGYVYALWLDPNAAPGGAWRCFYRSASLGAYAGMYNKIYPFKTFNQTSGRWETRHLVVFTPGYIDRFAVDASQVPTGGV